MFNLYPGQGLGRETSNRLAFGLGSWGILRVLTPIVELTNEFLCVTFTVARKTLTLFKKC